jgi:hypothetical protein
MELSEIDKREVAESLRNLRGAAPAREILERLNRLGIWSRGSIEPRGTLAKAAQNRLPDADQTESILTFLQSGEPEIRQQAARALGQWGGRECIEGLRDALLSADTDSVTRQYCISGLRNIGGADATAAIIAVMKWHDSEVQDAALSAIEDLKRADSKQSLPERLNAELGKILEDLKTSDSTPLALRFRATELLASMVEQAVGAPAQGIVDRIRAFLGTMEFDPVLVFAIRTGPPETLLKTEGNWILEVEGISNDVARVSVETTDESLRGSRVRLLLIDNETRKEIDSIEGVLNKEGRMVYEWRIERTKLPSERPEKLQVQAYLL